MPGPITEGPTPAPSNRPTIAPVAPAPIPTAASITVPPTPLPTNQPTRQPAPLDSTGEPGLIEIPVDDITDEGSIESTSSSLNDGGNVESDDTDTNESVIKWAVPVSVIVVVLIGCWCLSCYRSESRDKEYVKSVITALYGDSSGDCRRPRPRQDCPLPTQRRVPTRQGYRDTEMNIDYFCS